MPATGRRTSSSLTVGSPWSKRSRPPPPPWALPPRRLRSRYRRPRRPRPPSKSSSSSSLGLLLRSFVLRPSLRLSGRPPRSLRSPRSGPRLPPSRLPPSRLPPSRFARAVAAVAVARRGRPPSRVARCGRAPSRSPPSRLPPSRVALRSPASRLRRHRGHGCAAAGRPRCARRRRARCRCRRRCPAAGAASAAPRRTANRPAGWRRDGCARAGALGGLVGRAGRAVDRAAVGAAADGGLERRVRGGGGSGARRRGPRIRCGGRGLRRRGAEPPT